MQFQPLVTNVICPGIDTCCMSGCSVGVKCRSLMQEGIVSFVTWKEVKCACLCSIEMQCSMVD